MQDESVIVGLRQFEELCRQKGLPITVQRRVILETVLRRDDHPTADQIFEAVQEQLPQLSRTTIYRVLDTFVDLGIIKRLQQSGAARFDGKASRHHHLLCTECGKVIDLEDKALDSLPLPKRKFQGFKVSDFSVHFSGVCPACQKKTNKQE